MYRALPLAIGIAALQAPSGLGGRVRAVVVAINLAEMPDAMFGILLLGIASRHFQEL